MKLKLLDLKIHNKKNYKYFDHFQYEKQRKEINPWFYRIESENILEKQCVENTNQLWNHSNTYY